MFYLILDQARLNLKGLLGLAGGMRYTECHSSFLDNWVSYQIHTITKFPSDLAVLSV